jgi:hypothetical protein
MNNVNSKQFLWILLILALVLTAIVASGATTLEPMSFERLTRQATAIARLRCVGVQSVWDGGEIWTDSRFEVLQQEKTDAYGADQFEYDRSKSRRAGSASRSASGAEITVRQLGGSIGGLHAHVDDVPQFHAGEEVYLFLWRRAGEPYRVLGWAQGAFRVARDQRTGTERVTQDSADAAFHGDVRGYQSSGIRNLSLAAFQERLRAAIARGAASAGAAGAARED